MSSTAASVAPAHASKVTLVDFTSSVLAAQSSAVRALAESWAHSTQLMLTLAPTPWRPQPRAQEAAANPHGPGAEKIVGVPADVQLGWETTFTRRITAELIEAFGEVSGDESRLHYDQKYAEKSRFGGRISHGLLTASFISAALSKIPGLVVYLSQDLKFLAPAKPGDEATARIKVIERPENKPWMRLSTVVTLQDGTVVAEGEAKVLVLPEP